MAHGFGLAFFPLEAIGQVFAAPDERMLTTAVRALYVVLHIGFRLFTGTLYVAQAFDAGRAAAHKLGVRRTLQTALGQAAWVAGLFNGLIECGPFIQNGHGHRNTPVSTCCLAAQQVQHRVTEGLVLDGVHHALALLACSAHGGHAVQHGLNLAFDVAVPVIIRGLPQRLLAAAVGDVVGHKGRDHLGIAHALGLFDGQLLDAVIAHEVQNAALEGPPYPAALLVAGLTGQDEVLGRPLAQRLWLIGAQAVQP